MVGRFSRHGSLTLAQACVQVGYLDPGLLAMMRRVYVTEPEHPEEPIVGIMGLALAHDIDPDVVALAVRGYGYKGKGYGCSGGSRLEVDVA